MNDFSSYFGPQGKVAAFFSAHLKPYVDTSARPWKPVATGGAKIGISNSALRHFEKAARIRAAFFSGGSAQPLVNFQMLPLYLDKAARQVLIELGEQRLTYRHGPTRRQGLQWPPSSGSTRARLVFTPLGGAQSYSLVTQLPNRAPEADCPAEPTEKEAGADCCVTVSAAELSGGFFDPNGDADIDTICISELDGGAVACEPTVVVCDTGNHTVEVTITDLAGESDSCDATVEVVEGPEGGGAGRAAQVALGDVQGPGDRYRGDR